MALQEVDYWSGFTRRCLWKKTTPTYTHRTDRGRDTGGIIQTGKHKNTHIREKAGCHDEIMTYHDTLLKCNSRFLVCHCSNMNVISHAVRLLQDRGRPMFGNLKANVFFATVKMLRTWQNANKYVLKVPYYTVFHQFHTAVRGPTALYSICIALNPTMVLNFSCLKVALQSSTQSSLFLCLHL